MNLSEMDAECLLNCYATDASMYQIKPKHVEFPADRKEVIRTLHRCKDEALAVVPRGGGTSLVGQSIGSGVILDCSRYLNHVLELCIDEGWVRVEPGMICGELNKYLRPYGYCFAPDPATLNRATIGGMIANNSSGMRSVRYGMTIDHVLDVELALASGEVFQFGSLDQEQVAVKCKEHGREGEMYRTVLHLLQVHAEEIQQRYPKVIRRSGGYAFDSLLDIDSFNLAKLICGSEGTLGVILSAKLRLTGLPKQSAVALAHFNSVDAALRTVPAIVGHHPSAVELLDGTVLHQARKHPSTQDICSMLVGEPEAVLVIEVQGDDPAIVKKGILSIAGELADRSYACPLMLEPSGIKAVWQLRSSALGLMTTVKGSRKPVPYIEDAAVPLENLADYVAEVATVCRKHHQPVALFGHASVGLLHIRPMHDLHKSSEIHTMKAIQEEVFQLVMKYGGSWSGEHGDGIVRGGYNQRFFGDALYGAFRELKGLFDPEGRMNPGKVIDTPPMEKNLRFDSHYKQVSVDTLFHYRNDGGIHAAAEQCTGVGECRKTLSGVMCPSFMVTMDEMHSTRGRANMLRLVLGGQIGVDALASDELQAVMDLCLSCKGCKAECPNSVDMAKLKSEVLYHVHKQYGIPLRAQVFGSFARLSTLAAGPQAGIVNGIMSYRAVRLLCESFFGIDAKSRLPAFAPKRLSRLSRKQQSMQDYGLQYEHNRTVILYNDTYTEYFQPQVGIAAIQVLAAAGYDVLLATVGDSQRMAISQGLLDKAKRDGEKLFKRLDRFSDNQCPIVVCEPSCASALKDDLPDLLDDETLAERVAKRVVTIDRFLEQELDSDRCQLQFLDAHVVRKPLRILVHTHCHQHTLGGAMWTQRLLERIPGAVVEDTEAGCCGMAGSFGYEVEHARMAKEIAAQRLLPRLGAASEDTVIVANGFSCRHQIAELTEWKPVHVVEVIRSNCVIC